jgi:hypothetical protein
MESAQSKIAVGELYKEAEIDDEVAAMPAAHRLLVVDSNVFTKAGF